MIVYVVKGENDEGTIWTEGSFKDKAHAEKLLAELEAEGPHPYCEFYIKELQVK